MSAGGLALGLAMIAGSGRGGASTVEPVEVDGEASAMTGVAYNAPQPAVHGVTIPPGGSNTAVLNYSYPSNTELLLNSTSSKVECGRSGGQPGQTTAVGYCEVDIQGFELGMAGFEIITASRVRARASAITTAAGTEVSYVLSLEGLCVRTGLNGPCHQPGQGETVVVDWPPLSGTITVGMPVEEIGFGGGMSVTAFHVNIFNADYTDSQGNGSVVINVANARVFVGAMIPTPTPTRTPTPTKTATPTATPTPTAWTASLPGVARDP